MLKEATQRSPAAVAARAFIAMVEKVLASVSDHVSLANRLYTTRDR